MNEFRAALSAHMAGRLGLDVVQRQLQESLMRQPHLAAAHAAIVEAMYRGSGLAGDAYLALLSSIQSFQQTQSQLGVVKQSPPDTKGADGDRTVFRAPAPNGHDREDSAQSAEEEFEFAPTDADRTVFRPVAQGQAPEDAKPADPMELSAEAESPPGAESEVAEVASAQNAPDLTVEPDMAGADVSPPESADQNTPAAQTAEADPSAAEQLSADPDQRAAESPPVTSEASAPSSDAPAETEGTASTAENVTAGDDPAPATDSNEADADNDKTQFRVPTPAPLSGEADKTQFRVQPSNTWSAQSQSSGASDADKTQFRVPSPTPTPFTNHDTQLRPVTTGGNATTGGSHTGPISFDDTGTKVRNRTGPPTNPTRDSTTGSSWSHPARWATNVGPPLGAGSVINHRFVLEEPIGRGGMGTVFRARDQRKEEAQDRNPYVAIKILNEDFKRHPQSLQALQRESRKAQKLAHPNIVTVYDFDRDGANVYMVMELLEGESLDRVIKRTEGVGLGVKEAIRITRDVCRAMSYAHEQGIVHADFKPANAFLTREGVVKVFDFGIARAAKRNDQSAGQQTLFDPGTLGALTPAYAGCEVIEGEDPDTRDDVYAIACVTYELITGRHPFNRLSAVQARDAFLVPEQPPGLSKRQWRTLERGLSFRRDRRPKSAMEFFDGILPLRRSPAMYAAAGVAAITVVVLAATLIDGQIDKYRERSVVAALASGNPQQIEPMLQDLRELEPAQRASVFLDESARAGLIKFFEDRVKELVDATKGRYNYPQAEVLLRELEDFFPDSQAVRDIRDRVTARKSDEIKRQSDAFDLYLQNGWLIPAQNRENIGTVLAVIREIDPRNRLLRDPRLPGAFAEQAGAALKNRETALADALVTAGLSFEPNDPVLTDLRDQVKRAASSQQMQARKAQLEGAMAALVSGRGGLAAIDRQSRDIGELRAIDPANPALQRVQRHIQLAIDEQAATLVSQNQFDKAQELVARYADLVSPTFVEAKRRELADAQNRAQTRAAAAVANAQTGSAAVKPSSEATDEELRTEIAAGLRKSSITLDEARKLAGVVDELTRRGDKDALTTERKLRKLLADSSLAVRKRKGIDAAIEYAEGAYALYPESPALKKTVYDLRLAAVQRTNANRETAVAEIKTKIETLLGSPRQEDAWGAELERELRRLAAYLPESDPYVAQVKARAASVYVSLAGQLRNSQRLTEAGRMLERSREYAPQSAELVVEETLLADARARQDAEMRQRDREAPVKALKQKLFVQAQANEVIEAQASLKELRDSLPSNDPFLTKYGPEAIGQAYLRMASSAAKDGRFKNAVELTNRGRDIAPFMPQINSARTRYSRYLALNEHLTTRSRLDVRGVRNDLQKLAQQDANETSAVVQRLTRNLANRIASTTDPELADRLLKSAREIFVDEPMFRVAGPSSLPGAGDGAGSTPPSTGQGGGGGAGAPAAAQPQARPISTTSGSAAPAPEEAAPGECTANLAGKGRRADGVCHDTFKGGRGPDLVVIPPSGPIDEAYAIGRTEVSLAQYSAYCERSTRCKRPSGTQTHPITFITVVDAQRYMAWLSRMTGATYRLPTAEEWHRANSGKAVEDINCIAWAGGKKVRGVALMDVSSGTQNQWGLYNGLGNAQEWVRTGDTLTVRGGAYTDAVAACKPDTSRSHAGSADPVTGFRVVRELG